jgi:hypothetical protein
MTRFSVVVILFLVVGTLTLFSKLDLLRAQKMVEVSDDPMFTYDPGEWRDPNEPAACFGGNWHEGVVFNAISYGFTYPTYGYPLRSRLVVGLNDTAQVEIFLNNRTDKPYSLLGKKPETWFVPRVYRMEDNLHGGIAWRDSTDLAYRIRGWRRGQKYHMSPQDTIPAWFNGTWSMVMDVWKLPEGHFSLCIDTTRNIPKDFVGCAGGDNYEYYKAQDLADTINAYEGCFWRMIYDSNYTAAKTWIDKMIAADSATVPGWWLKATYYYYVRDFPQVKNAYDKALSYLTANADPAMPDSTKRPLLATERNYVEWCRQRITWERSVYGP